MSKPLQSWMGKVGGDGAGVGQTHGGSGLILPFKPFTLEEVAQITGCKPQVIDCWVGVQLPLQRGDNPNDWGLSYMQTFAVFVGWKWLQEGADAQRANCVVAFVGNISREFMLQEFGKGNSFPGMVQVPNKVIGGPPEIRGIMVKPDRRQAIMRRLDLATHFDEFLTQIDRFEGKA
jgi:hypothetical protein